MIELTGNSEFINYIHQNSQMGQNTIKQLITITEDDGFKTILENQFNEYKNIYEQSAQLLSETDKESKSISPITKISTYIMINMKTLNDKSPSHIAQMLIQGSTMGIIDITKKLKVYKDTEPKILELGNRLLQFEQASIEELKKYL